MNLFGMIDNSGAAMQAERMRAEVVAANMANAETTRTAAGTPYQRQHVIFSSGSGDKSFAGQLAGRLISSNSSGPLLSGETAGDLSGLNLSGSSQVAPGVHIAGVVKDSSPPLKRYDPSHPDADAQGYVSYPDIDPLTEMVDLMGATRAYGLNGSAVQAEKSMISSALEIAK
ncbi:flagellar basal body rod protein FlgC [Acidicapsa ligni]|uniref:flagellar basal body rod protein FlgC n=1 Tax=Acidicapsa ligni TaxID=542300 RepID=UPI0021E025DE|nr:flagellar basal body rod protein FlgC [Acidicapsa ligni]